ncbi:proton myo-inositol cotransporter-like isoform X2 [Bolinopsis microptera]|uniref:proton myo-inositol cotransporter-like isoform X2 n=1 Tax=Bolinopsis microptera TaxID=2820187 RepID=UPI003078CFCC
MSTPSPEPLITTPSPEPLMTTSLMEPEHQNSDSSSIQASFTDEASLLNPTSSNKPKLTLFLVLLCGVSTIGGFLFGYDTGVVSGALIKLKQDFNLSPEQEEWIVGIAVAAAALGAGLGGAISNTLGRKPTIILSSIFFTLGSALLFSAKTFTMLIIGRVVLGLGVGLASMVVPPYIAESSPAAYRGKLVTAFGATVCWGQFTASLVDGAFSTVHEGWRWMLGIATVPSIIMGLGMLLLPESARFLIQKGKFKEAEATLQKISGCDDVSAELKEIGLALLGGAYFSISKTTALVTSTNSTCPGSGTVILNCGACVSNSDCVFCSTDKSSEGRCILPTVSDNCTEPDIKYRAQDVCYSPYSWTIIAAMVFYIAMFATGIGTLAWTINSEIYPMWVRGYALSISTMTNWLFNLLIAFTFLDLTRILTKYGAFWLYTGITVVGWIIFYFKLPETRGVPLERVEQLFS